MSNAREQGKYGAGRPLGPQGFSEWLKSVITGDADVSGPEAPGGGVRNTEQFCHSGLLTRDTGLVVKLRDGSEYQVTVVQSRRAR